jgi:hypothetical protein
MAVSTGRTARYGGAVATFTTAASPGAALSALFTNIDTALTTAGWTRIINGGASGPNTYTSNGESGLETLFLVLSTGGYGIASGVELSGGSYICAALCQWADASGNYCNKMGAPRLSSSAGQPSTGINVLPLAASTTYEHFWVVDKDGLFIGATPSGTSNGLRWLWTGVAARPASYRGSFTSTGTIANGTNVVIGLSGNPVAAGYQVGDIIEIVGQQVGGSTATLGDIVACRISALTTSSVTVDSITALTATLASGALVGEMPQPLYGGTFNQASQGPFGVSANTIVAPLPGWAGQSGSAFGAANLWSQQLSSTGTGGAAGSADGATGAYKANGCNWQFNSPTPAGLATSGVDPRTGAAYMAREVMACQPNSPTPWSTFILGYCKYARVDQRTSTAAAVGTLGRELQSSTNEWVAVTHASSTPTIWAGPFPKTSPTVTVRMLDRGSEFMGDYLIVNEPASSGSDNLQMMTMDRPLPNDFVTPALPTNVFNQGLD